MLKFFRQMFPGGAPGLLWRLVKLVDPYVLWSYSQEGEDMVVRRLFDNLKNGFYVDVGAHHPLRYSNTSYFYRMGWRGINIDADPRAISAFQRARPRDINLAIGISDEKGSLAFHILSDPALNTFDAKVAERAQTIADYHVVSTIDVPVVPLVDVLGEHLPAGQSIHLLNVDAEGYDLRVLRSNNWEQYRPRCVLVEARRTTVEDILDDDTCRFMIENGYRLLGKTVNTAVYVESGLERKDG